MLPLRHVNTASLHLKERAIYCLPHTKEKKKNAALKHSSHTTLSTGHFDWGWQYTREGGAKYEYHFIPHTTK